MKAMTRSEARRVSCPECKARAGHRCRERGEPASVVHRSRYERAENPVHQPQKKKDIENRRTEILLNAGALWTRRLRRTGGFVTLYVAAQQGIDTGGEKYALVCEEHASILAVRSMERGAAHAGSPEGWCPRCRGEEVAS